MLYCNRSLVQKISVTFLMKTELKKVSNCFPSQSYCLSLVAFCPMVRHLASWSSSYDEVWNYYFVYIFENIKDVID